MATTVHCRRTVCRAVGALPVLVLAGAAARAAPAQTVGPQVTITEHPLPTPDALPGGLIVGPDGALWFHQSGANAIGRLTTDGRLSEFPIPTPDSSIPRQGFLGLGPDGAIWFTETRANKLGRLSPGGQFTEYPIPTAVPFENPQLGTVQTSFPIGITAGPDGAVWFTEGESHKLGRIVPGAAGGALTEIPLPESLTRPMGPIVGPDGALWFTARGTNRVGRMTLDGRATGYDIPTPGSGPLRLIAGPDRALWFAEFGAHQIGRLALDGTFSEYAAPGMGPVHLTVGPDGAIWFTGYSSNEIGRMTPDGVLTDRYPVPTPDSQPYQIVIGPDGAIWFTEIQGNKLGRIQLPAAARLPRTGGAAPPVPTWLLALGAGGLGAGLLAPRRHGSRPQATGAPKTSGT